MTFAPRHALRLATLGAALALSWAAPAQALDFSGATGYGDALITPSQVTLTTAWFDASLPDQADEGNTGAGSALDISVLEPALGLPAYALGELAYEGSALTLSFTAAAGSTLSFQWSTTGAQVGDLAWVWLDGGSPIRLTETDGRDASGQLQLTLAQGGAHTVGWAVVDQYDYIGTTALHLDGLMVTPVPEPASLALMLAGAAGLQLQRRAARRRALQA